MQNAEHIKDTLTILLCVKRRKTIMTKTRRIAVLKERGSLVFLGSKKKS